MFTRYDVISRLKINFRRDITSYVVNITWEHIDLRSVLIK